MHSESVWYNPSAMSKVQTIPYAFTVLTAAFLCVPCSASEDFQFWSTAGASAGLSKNSSIAFEEEFRFRDNAGRFYYHHSDLGFVYTGLADWLSVGFNYRQIFEEDSMGEWRQENRPHLNATLTGKVSGLSVSNRSRLEYRDREIKDDLWRYRNKLTVNLPAELTPLKLQPYFADEVFLNVEGRAFEINRACVGLTTNLLKNLKGDVYYVRQSSCSTDHWTDINIIGIQLRIAF